MEQHWATLPTLKVFLDGEIENDDEAIWLSFQFYPEFNPPSSAWKIFSGFFLGSLLTFRGNIVVQLRGCLHIQNLIPCFQGTRGLLKSNYETAWMAFWSKATGNPKNTRWNNFGWDKAGGSGLVWKGVFGTLWEFSHAKIRKTCASHSGWSYLQPIWKIHAHQIGALPQVLGWKFHPQNETTRLELVDDSNDQRHATNELTQYSSQWILDTQIQNPHLKNNNFIYIT